jgi:hypothetical protein
VRALLVAVVLAAALVGGYAALGGGGYHPGGVADPCLPRPRPASGDRLDGVQRATLSVLDGAACDLHASREDVLLTLLDRRSPVGADDDRLSAAVQAGIDRARKEGTLGATEATVLRFAVRAGGAKALLGLLLQQG